MSKSTYAELAYFQATYCPYKNNYCNGQHVPDIENGKDISEFKDLKKCKFYDKFEGCNHPNHPKYKDLKEEEE